MPVLSAVPKPPEQPPVPKGISAFELLEKDIPDPVRLCDPWATEGVNIIAGRPKLGKTTLIRQKLAAAATAGEFLDSHFPSKCKCAFLSLEEGELLTRAKLKAQGFTEEALGSVQLHFDWPRGQAGIDLLDRYLIEQPDVRYVAIDSLTRFRVIPDVRVPAFMADYEAVNALHEMSKKHPGVCFDVIHHTRKAKSEDAIDDVSGTYGLTAAADSIVVLRHHGDGVLMYIFGRLWVRDDYEFKLERKRGAWTMLGPNLGLSDEQEEALHHVQNSPDGLSGLQLAKALDISTQSAWQRLDILLEKGFVTKKFGRCFSKR